ncbi:single-stranded-DNA-specific exonuclease RecJ [bacterium]|nr:single-stranded-DNA-specific exonuclease RecJ [bacterium]
MTASASPATLNAIAKTWEIKHSKADLCRSFCLELNISARLATILINRGIDTLDMACDFLEPSLHNLPDPYLMAGMERSVERLSLAFRRKEKIVVFGDYDMDGISSTAILVDYLRRAGFLQVDYSIPSRLTDGYGLNLAAITKAATSGATLAITVDSGVSDIEEIAAANKLGLDIIVTDHHQIPDLLPPAHAIINPHLSECNYPDRNLAGVGVAFNLMMALRKRLRESGLATDVNLLQYLDLVALGTVADVMPLTGVNRIFVSFGLKEINKTRRLGLLSLLFAAKINQADSISARDLAFKLAPRVNAAGRIDDAKIAVELFLTKDRAIATRNAQTLEECNERRREIERDIKIEADEMIKKDGNIETSKVILLASENWHPGVVGIVSSRIAESYEKPAILIALKDGVGRGSGRSVEGLNLVDVLDQCHKHLIRYGGHEQAVGLTVTEENIPALREQMESYLRSSTPAQTEPSKLLLDGTLRAVDINRELLEELQVLQPLGHGNPEPIFLLETTEVAKVVQMGSSDRRHLKFTFIDSENRKNRFAGIYFNFKGTLPKAGEILDLAFTPEENIWRGKSEIRVNLTDFRFTTKGL